MTFHSFDHAYGTIVAVMGIFPPVFPWVTEASAEIIRTRMRPIANKAHSTLCWNYNIMSSATWEWVHTNVTQNVLCRV